MKNQVDDLATDQIDTTTFNANTTIDAITTAISTTVVPGQAAIAQTVITNTDPPIIYPRPLPFYLAYNPFASDDDFEWGNNKATFLFVGLMVFGVLLIVVAAHFFAKRRYKSKFVSQEVYEVSSSEAPTQQTNTEPLIA